MGTKDNPAALQGWVKSKDPKTGRAFYANHVTRKTQWDPPFGWEEDLAPPPSPQEEPLPANWEVLHDPSTGKPFYIDHESKITTWTRPTVTATPTSSSSSRSLNSSATSAPTSRSDAFQRILSSSASQQQQQQQSARSVAQPPASRPAARAYTPSARSYQQDSYHYTTPQDVDFSDALPPLDFRVKEVPDKYRAECPHCDAPFTVSKRRHHCRLCGDIFCDVCSSHRVELPLEGTEFEKPVRVCDFCHVDVERGNFFSMRRYLTPLILYEASNDNNNEEEEEGGVATAKNVAAALCALSTDLDSCLQNSSSFQEKVTIPTDVLVPSIVKHLTLRTTSDRAVRALASLLALGSIVNNMDFAHAVYLYGGRQTLDDILQLLERSGSDRKTLFLQEQAARAIFYLTDPSILSSLEAKQQQLQADKNKKEVEFGGVECLDMDRTLRNMLDHSSMSKNPALQRWSAASIRNLVVEDQRRACMAANDIAAAVASGQDGSSYAYESFLDQLVSTGGIMILCSLVGADDPDTRAHATGALGAVLASTRAVDASLVALSEMTGSPKPQSKDGEIIRAIVAGGGCGSSISQLLLSADNAVAGMGCDFISSLVLPLLEDARGSATLPSNYKCEYDNEGLGACREAALAMANGSCLPALLSLAKDAELGSRITRPMNLRKRAMETLAAVVMAVGQMEKAIDGSTSRLTEAIATLNAEGVVSVALAIMESSSSQSLVSSRDNPAVRIREAAGIILSYMTVCSPEALKELKSKGALSSLLAAASDADMFNASSLRADAAPRCLGVIQTASTILMHAWEHDDPASSQLLDRLLEAVDGGAISIASRVLFSKMDWESQDKSVGAMKAREACCRLLCAMFSVARNDDTGIGQVRLNNAVDAAAYSQNPLRNVTTATFGTLQTSASYARRALMGGGIQATHYHAALMDLVEATLLATGSMCGSSTTPGEGDFDNMDTDPTGDDKFKSRIQEACKVACDILVHRGRQGPLLPTMLVGGFGEGTVNASLRLALAIAQHGSQEQHSKLAMSGILIPIGDSLRNALSTGDLYRFSASLALVRFCGPHVAAGEGGGLQSVQDAIRVATNVLTLPVDPNADISQLEVQESLKSECINTLEALSKNASLWSAISKDALPSIVSYLHSTSDIGVESVCRHDTRVVALRAVLRLVQIPSHAVSASQAGLAEPLAKLLKEERGSLQTGSPGDDDIPMLALEIMHVLVSNAEARRHAQLLQCGVFQSVCRALGNAATYKPEKPTDCRADIAFWGLEILHFVLLDVENSGDFAVVLQSPVVNDVVDTAARETNFLRALCATLLNGTGMKLPCNVDDERANGYEIPDLYGPPLVLVNESCAGFPNTHSAAVSLLFSVSVYACAIERSSSETFWETLLLKQGDSGEDSEDVTRLSATTCAKFLSILSDKHKMPLNPSNGRKRNAFESISRPLVRHRLLEGLKSCLEGQRSISLVPGMSNSDPYMRSLLVGYQIPQLCLSLWRDPALIDVSFELIKLMVDEYNEDVLPLFVQSKIAILSLFDMLTLDTSVDSVDVNVEDFRRLVASILGSLAEEGLLTQSVDQFEVRSSAISALAAACLAEDETALDDDGDAPATSARMSSRCMQCLVELCTVETEGTVHRRKMKLSQEEAEAITRSLGKKICQMVTSRFLERAKLEQYDVKSDDDIMDAPDVSMLCAVAQHESALQILRSIGGLHALCLIASEGDPSALNALHQASIDDPSLILDVDGQAPIINLFSEESRTSRNELPEVNRQVETAAFAVLAQLCSRSKGRNAVTEGHKFDDCLLYAVHLISSLVESTTDKDEEADETDEGATTEGDEPGVKNSLSPESVPVNIRSLADASLETAAIKFLSSVVPSKICRCTLLRDHSFIRASLEVAKSFISCVLQSEVVHFLVAIAPYAKDEQVAGLAYSAEHLMAAFRGVVHFDIALEWQSVLSDVNLVQSKAVEGAERIFECVSSEFQRSVIVSTTDRFARLVNTFTRPSGKETAREHGGLLACSLTLLLLRSVGNKDAQDLVFTKDLLTSMIHLVQWRCDSKSRAEMPDPLHWDAAICHCLQIIAFVFQGTEDSLKERDMLPTTLARTVLMMARPGKAPRKATDFITALRRIIDEGTNTATIVAAQRILRAFED